MIQKIINIKCLKSYSAALLIIAALAFSVSCDFRKPSEANATVTAEEGKYSEPPGYDDSVLSVIQATPQGRVLLTEGRREIYVVFNHPLVPLAALEKETKGVFTISPAVKGKYRWYGSRICSFIPDEGWSADTEYTVKISAGLRSLNSRKLGNDYTFKFKIEVPELGVYCYPYRSESIDYDQNFTITFTHAVRKDDLYKYLILKSGKRQIPYTLTTSSKKYYGYDDESETAAGDASAESSRTIIVKPQDAFDRNSEVTLEIRKGLRSEKNDSRFLNSTEFKYKTHGPLEVTFNEAGSYFQELWNSGFHFTNYVDMKTAVNSITFSPPGRDV